MSRILPSRLYAIADGSGRSDVVAFVRDLVAAGARIVQLRWKHAPSSSLLAAARECRRLARESGASFVVNDRADVALACEADGVHLGQGDLPLVAARRMLGDHAWIGISTHDVAQALRAERESADYIGFGPVFATGSKDTWYSPRGLDSLVEVRRAVRLPIVAIGGITAANAQTVLEAGADAVAMISALVASDVREGVRDLLGTLDAP